MQRNKLNSWFSISFNPFNPDIPCDKLWCPPDVNTFMERVVMLADVGGFALVSGDPGCGKSSVLRLLRGKLENIPDMRVAVLSRPQSNIPDLYRELGEIFGVEISPFNRWHGFSRLREQWKEHVSTTLSQPVLLVDEAQLMFARSLNELRLLSSLELDSKNALTVVLCGDKRLTENFKDEDLLPLATRIRIRLNLDRQSPESLLVFMNHMLKLAGNPDLITDKLKHLLVDGCMGNFRVLTTLVSDMLNHAMIREIQTLDEKLYFEIFSHTGRATASSRM